MTLKTRFALTVLAVTSMVIAPWQLLQAQTVPGKAEVREVKGVALASTGGAPGSPMKVGTILGPGTTIKTGAGSSVLLFLGKTAGFVRMAENTTLGLIWWFGGKRESW